MQTKLKKLRDQVIVLTGATSGIGLTTAREAARRGAKLVLVARNGEALAQLEQELVAQGSQAIHVVADVGDEAQVRQVSRQAIAHFGGFDTWINNAGVSIFGRSEQVSLEDQRRLFETNFWGVVHGSLVAVEHLKTRGGALINIGSEVSDRAVPLQGIYSASKHAVKGFTDSLRMELEEEGAPVSVTLIKPAAIDTMFVPHAKNYLDVEPRLSPPVYAPEVAADAILHAAQHPRRDIYVGSGARAIASGAQSAPGILDSYMKRFLFRQQRSARPARSPDRNSLHGPGDQELRERQGHDGKVFETSWYTRAATHPGTTRALMIGAGLVLAALWQTRRRPVKRKTDAAPKRF